MKKFAFLILAVLFLSGCSNNPQSMAEKGVKSHLEKSIAAYEPISFGVLDTINLSNDATYKTAKDSLNFYMNALKETADQFKLAANQNNAKKFRGMVDSLDFFYEGKKFRINHKYKANTSEGKNEEVDKVFYLNSGYVVVD